MQYAVWTEYRRSSLNKITSQKLVTCFSQWSPSDFDPKIAVAYDADNLKDFFKYYLNITDSKSKFLYKEVIKNFRCG